MTIKIKVIFNPRSGRSKLPGRRNIQYQLQNIIGKLLMDGTAEHISVTRTEHRGHACETAAALHPGEYDLLIVCGGDGTVNETVNGLMQSGSRTPLAILAAGTSNDFATSLRLPRTAEEFCAMVRNNEYRDIDIGRANGRYFINVASFGMFTEVAHNTDQQQKNTLGMLAYYLKVALDAPAELRNSFPLTFNCEETSGAGDYHVALVANSMSVGSIRNLMNQADVSDGLFDVMMLRRRKLGGNAFNKPLCNTSPLDLEQLKLVFPYAAESLTRLQQEQELDENNAPALVYFQTRHIEFSSPKGEEIATDLDGESFGTLPLTVDVAHHAVRLLVPPAEEPTLLRLAGNAAADNARYLLLHPQPPRKKSSAATDSGDEDGHMQPS